MTVDWAAAGVAIASFFTTLYNQVQIRRQGKAHKDLKSELVVNGTKELLLSSIERIDKRLTAIQVLLIEERRLRTIEVNRLSNELDQLRSQIVQTVSLSEDISAE